MAKMPVDRAKRWEDVFRTLNPTPKAENNSKASEPEQAWNSLHRQAIKAVLPVTPKNSSRK